MKWLNLSSHFTLFPFVIRALRPICAAARHSLPPICHSIFAERIDLNSLFMKHIILGARRLQTRRFLHPFYAATYQNHVMFIIVVQHLSSESLCDQLHDSYKPLDGCHSPPMEFDPTKKIREIYYMSLWMLLNANF